MDLHSLDAERGLIGSAIIDPDGFPMDDFMTVPSDAYWGERNRLIASRMRSMMEQDISIDLVTLVDTLRLNGELERAGSVAYVMGCAEGVPTTEHSREYARTILDLAARRQLVAFAGETSRLARDVAVPLDEAYGRVEEQLTLATRTVEKGHGIDAYAEQARRSIEGDDEGHVYFRTGLAPVDRLVGGLKGLVIVGARPSMGKSSLARDILRYQVRQGRKVALFTQDQLGSDTLSFEASIRSQVPLHKLKQGLVRADQRDAWFRSLGQVRDEYRPLFAIDDRPHNIHALASRIRAAARWGADLIAVDYLQLVDVPNIRDGNTVMSTSLVSKTLKRLTQELGIPIIALAQLSRAVESRDPPRPRLSDLRESGQVEQDAEAVLFLYRSEYYAARDQGRQEDLESYADIIISKNKTGPTGTARVLFQSEYATFRAI